MSDPIKITVQTPKIAIAAKAGLEIIQYGTLTVGETTTLAAGENATVSNSGTVENAVLNFGIPKGHDGTAATITIGTVTTGEPGSNASVTNVGTDTAAVLDISIPRGADWTGTDVATTEEAIAGVVNDKVMTPLRVKQAMDTMTFIDLLPVGWVSYKEFLLPQHVKANGATVNRSDYPSLAAYATEHNLWTDDPASEPYKYGRGDGSTTMVLPDYRGRFIMGGDNALAIAPGLPNVTGSIAKISETFATDASSANNSALYKSANTPNGDNTPAGTDASNAGTLAFDASRSNSIYGASETVQPPAISFIPQIKY